MGYIKNATLHQNQSSLGRVELQGRRELERTELKPIEIERTELPSISKGLELQELETDSVEHPLSETEQPTESISNTRP